MQNSVTTINGQSYALGWLPDFPDCRDYTTATAAIQPLLAKADVATPNTAVPTKVNLQSYFSEVENQETIGSCTAHAAIGLLEYFERRAFGKHIDASRLFLYKVTRNLLHWTGDTGAFLRSVMGAMALFGVPPEEYYPYDISKFEEEPSAFHYALGQNYQAISYYRLDSTGISRADLLKRIKANLASGLPSMFGFSVYDSLYSSVDGKIPYPGKNDKAVGGHAVVACGYDDTIKIKTTDGRETTGALMIRNSWGTGWGERGYGYLPYDYVLMGLAEDWWSLMKSEWIETGQFGR